jgi:hypothetical protein
MQDKAESHRLGFLLLEGIYKESSRLSPLDSFTHVGLGKS